ncbi:MAG TPA: tRNA uridine-5-carboxymethylaminomethyl(34) synthesis GTPase MnmE [Candidatus Binataceae bacterium]|nr:tRNA uridine-5-carboxymethylaminomethyl(34) synthesis GTPase MnmE [Candidatus Binataceae bacterium]
MYVADTIVASATAPGRAAVAILRLSGPRALAIARALWHPLNSSEPAPRALRLGEIRNPHSGARLDRAMCAFFPAPRSLTGEDVAELHCHGGVYLVGRILGLAADLGARLAEPGEFTRRAWLNGRIDLTAAEAIADLVDARGETALAQAIAQLGGALAERVSGLRDRLLAIRAHLEAEIDFADEDLTLPSRRAIADDIEGLAADIRMLRDSFARGRLAREGARAALIGKPNAGKSSILNLLLGANRAIVTPIPGTTRDVIEDAVNLGPWPLVLADTAGIREGRDDVERIGIERTRDEAVRADLLLPVFDSARPFDSDDADVVGATAGRAGVAILNKRDLMQALDADELRRRGLTLPLVDFSATTPFGLGQLRGALTSALERLAAGAGPGDGIAISRERHRAALTQTVEALAAARDSALAAMPPEIVAVDLAAAADALVSLTGVISNEDLLDAIFREFCIGK